jgi:hypothetical protein
MDAYPNGETGVAVNIEDDRGKEMSELDAEALFVTLKEWFAADFAHSGDWRTQAREDFDFVAGDQWKAADKAALDDQGRPVITFNRSLSVIKAVAGIEINGRHETVYLPRGTSPGAIKANELLSAASQWMADGCDAEDEQSEAFQDALICGMGWTELTIDYETEQDGAYSELKIDPLEMVWDKSARSKNLQDARRVFRARRMNISEARDLAASIGAGDVDDADLHATWALGMDKRTDLKPVEERRHRFENSGPRDPKSEVIIVHAQWYDKEHVYRTIDPRTGQEAKLSKQDFEALTAELGGREPLHVIQSRKVYKQALLGSRLIGKVRPGLCKERFTFQCITGERHRNKGTWFGLIHLMRDPQMWANKWLSQTLHILNTTAKGGIIAERDAFSDIRSAQETYARPDAITFAEAGAIQKGKIMQKPGTGMPAGYINLLEFAISSIRDVTGINMELLGLRDANQPGVLEAQRKQAAMTILATLFDSLRRFRKNVGRVRLYFIQTFLADDRLIRIAGEDGMQAVHLTRDQTLGDYEVIVEDAPTSPNQKEQTWGTLQMMLPVFRDMLTPEATIAILEYSPLPSKLVDTFKAMASKPNPEAEEAAALAKEGQMAKIDKDKASAMKDRTKAQTDYLQGIIDLIQAGMAVQPPPAPMPPMEPPRRMLEGEDYAIHPVEGGGRPMPMMPTTPLNPVGQQLPELPMAPADGAMPPVLPNGHAV